MTPLERLQWIICFSGFLDLFGVAMLYPLLIHQAKTLGATPGQVGLFGSIYGTLQFFTSPIMGQLSDHVGRRTVLLMSLVGTAVGYILLGMSNSIILMALARVPSGIFKHSQSMSRTYLADISPPQQRASAFGMFNSMSSLGFIVGPTLGGILSTTENGFQRVAMLSSLLFILNACFVYLLIPKYFGDKKMDEGSRITPNKPKFDFLSSLNTFKDVHLIPWHLVWDVFTVRFLMSFSMILYRSNSSSVLAYKFDADARTNGYIISFNGIVSAIAGVLVRWIAPYFSSNSSLNNAFSIILILSLVAITLAPTLFVVVIAMIPLCIASSVLRVTNATAIFNRGGERVRGLVNGLGDTLTSLARALGPAIAGYAQEVSLYGPGGCGIVLAVIGTLVGLYSPAEDWKFHVE
ncbi:major facilitator superfamily domain-containing protein 9-like isoform X2 [Hydractinia symbiolongicarpus]|uniref:major facilitator superfamily domain-containing protein 9-like isoform X2 n=1 Tax=Hydractinia symbiolongicarpus TaxID=13093 RepID=UPI00254ACA67|nr:major facilitator superfamily domain-containing protein 9-like isoform X2 [Hydractinia symbiolongicarpus]